MNGSLWQKLKNCDCPIIALEWRRSQRHKVRFWLPVALGVMVSLTAFVGLTQGYLRSAGSDFFDLPIPGIIAFMLLVALKWGVAYLVVPSNCSRAIAQEREAGNFQMLAMTPMSSALILWQKAAVGLLPAVVIAILAIPTIIPSLMSPSRTSYDVTPWLIAGTDWIGMVTYPIDLALFAAIGLWSSCWASNTRSAVSLAYLLVLVALPTAMYFAFFVTFGALHRAFPLFDSGTTASLFAVEWVVFQTIVSAGLAVLLIRNTVRRLDYLRTHVGGMA